MKNIRRTSIVAAIIMIVACAVSFAQEQSDYQIAQSFSREYKALTKAIETAQTVQECAEISVNIDAMEKGYAPHKALLDKTLYPDNFQKKIEMVRGQLAYAQNKLGIIQESVAKIAALEGQVKEKTKLLGDLQKKFEAMEKEYLILYDKQQAAESSKP